MKTYGNGLNKRKEDPARCIEEVWSGFISGQCRRKRVIGDYCKQHHKKKLEHEEFLKKYNS